MKFTILPPEINSARLYAGAGPEPMLAAAAAWDGLAADLRTSAASFESITSGLVGASWQGPASAAMTAAAAPYLAWLRVAAEHALHTSAQARTAAGAFETALLATVHPAVVSANRTGLWSLIGSNLLGLNAPAIAAAEAEYEQMWAQDVAAMAGYYTSVSTLVTELTPWQQLLHNMPAAAFSGRTPGVAGSLAPITASVTGPGTAFAMGTAFMSPTASYAALVDQLFIAPYHPGFITQGLNTPEQYWPLTGLTSLTFGQSITQSARALDDAIMAQLGNRTLVFGYSQSSSVATLEMRHLMSLPADLRPSTDDLSFVLAANPNRPNGGFLERFAGLYIPVLDLPFFGATPANAYPTLDYAIQYDGQADFPQFPINLLADANAFAGMIYVHSGYLDLTPAQIASAVVQPVSSPDTLTTYLMIPSHNLPLLEPLRAVPLVGNPLADLVQPDLRVLVELGYDRTGYQDVPTPAGLFPHFDPISVAAQLQQGAVQGVGDALADLGLTPPAFLRPA